MPDDHNIFQIKICSIDPVRKETSLTSLERYELGQGPPNLERVFPIFYAMKDKDIILKYYDTKK